MTLVFEKPTAALDLTDIVESAADALENAPAEEIVRWAIATFGERICVTSSMKDAVLVDIASKIRPGIDVLFVDTGYHFAETIGTRDAVEASTRSTSSTYGRRAASPSRTATWARGCTAATPTCAATCARSSR